MFVKEVSGMLEPLEVSTNIGSEENHSQNNSHNPIINYFMNIE